MSYIEREAAIAFFTPPEGTIYPNGINVFPETLVDAIKNIPAADVRPVVLCRDCVNYGEMLSGYDHRLICHKFALTTKPDDFCSRGERRNCGADMREEQA